MNRSTGLGVAGAVMGALLFGASANADTITLRYAHPTSANSMGGQMADFFAERLAELSGGAMEVRVFPDGQLGSLSELNELTASGTIEMSHNTWGSLSVFDPEASALDAPYVFGSPRERFELLAHEDSQVLDTLNQILSDGDTGLHILAGNGANARHATCNRAFYAPEDLEGVKFRAIPFPVFVATVQGMGAIPVPIEYSELTTALATGLVDCQENPLTNIYYDNLYESQTHIMLTNHIIAGGPILMNADFFGSLTEEQQGWVEQAARDAALFELERGEAQEAELRETLEGLGLTFVGVEDGLDVDAFSASVQEEMRQEFGDLYDRILNMVASERESLL